MNLNAILQPSFVVVHLACVALLVIGGFVWGSKRWAAVLSAIAILTGGIATIFLFVVLVGVVADPGGPGVISPIVFAGGFVVCFGSYFLLLVLAWLLRPKPFKLNAAGLVLALAGFALLNGSFLLFPTATATKVTVHVRDADSKPVSGARLVYTSKLQEGILSDISNADGRIILSINQGDTIDGRFDATQEHSEVKLYISAPGGRHSVWGIQRHWSLYFGSGDMAAYNFFLSEFDDPRDHSINVYLPSPNRPALLPYSALQNLAERLSRAQKTGKMFNPELNVQNLESYVQLVDVARTYDPRSSVCHYAQNIFTYLKLQHDELSAVLKKLTTSNVADEVKVRGLSQMSSVLGLTDSGSNSWESLRDQIQTKLNADLTILDHVPKP